MGKKAPPPPCICGGSLVRTHGTKRLEVFAKSRSNGSAYHFKRIYDQIASRNTCGVLCDVCDKQVALDGFVWRCEHGTTTMFHATAYDVCEECFLLNAVGKTEPSQAAAGYPISHQ